MYSKLKQNAESVPCAKHSLVVDDTHSRLYRLSRPRIMTAVPGLSLRSQKSYHTILDTKMSESQKFSCIVVGFMS